MKKFLAAAMSLLVVFTAGCSISFPTLTQTTPEQTTTPAPIQPGFTLPPVNGTSSPLPSVADVVPLVTPSVVSIQTEAAGLDIFLRPLPEQGAGSGVIIDANGYVITNNHVVEGADKVTVTLNDGRTFEATDVRTDVISDLAVIKVDATNLPAVKLGDSTKLRVGEWVIAIGNALALEGGPTVTAGIVSTLGRSIQEPNGAVLYDLIQTDAAINPGNSGGPLLNLSGEVVGINTAIASGSAQNIGFAIAITPALSIVRSLIDRGFAVRPFLGVTMNTLTAAAAQRLGLPINAGVLLTSVSAGSPAQAAGLQQGDAIVRFAGRDVETVEELRRAIHTSRVGAQVEIVFYRGSAQQTASATLGETPPQ